MSVLEASVAAAREARASRGGAAVGTADEPLTAKRSRRKAEPVPARVADADADAKPARRRKVA
jgi:hypothetical protein